MLLWCQISYTQIKVCLTIQNRGISVESILSDPNAEERVNKARDSKQDSINACKETPCESKNANHLAGFQLETIEEIDSVLSAEDLLANKRQRLTEPMEESSVPLKATESSVLSWLNNCNEGVSEMWITRR